MSKNVLVSCQCVGKQFTSGGTITQALKGIDLEIFAGELFMLVGPSGCGKTTLISIIAGVLENDSGTVTVAGKQFADLSEADRNIFRGKTIGFVFQAFNLIPQLTSAENVAIPLLINGVKYREAVLASKELLAKVGLAQKTESLPNQLSGGQQQRVAIARALIHKPQIIVCDEPTSALDHKTGAEVMELLKLQAKENQSTLIIVTHDSRIYSYADRIAEMEDGMIQRVQTPIEQSHTEQSHTEKPHREQS